MVVGNGAPRRLGPSELGAAARVSLARGRHQARKTHVLGWVGRQESPARLNGAFLVVVGILRTYSNSEYATRQVNDLLARIGQLSGRKKVKVVTPPRSKKLTAKQVYALCSLYKEGSSTYALARQFGIRRDQVSIVLKRASVAVDPGPLAKLSDSDRVKIVELSRSGLSLRKIGSQFGVSDNTVLKAIREHRQA